MLLHFWRNCSFITFAQNCDTIVASHKPCYGTMPTCWNLSEHEKLTQQSSQRNNSSRCLHGISKLVRKRPRGRLKWKSHKVITLRRCNDVFTTSMQFKFDSMTILTWMNAPRAITPVPQIYSKLLFISIESSVPKGSAKTFVKAGGILSSPIAFLGFSCWSRFWTLSLLTDENILLSSMFP